MTHRLIILDSRIKNQELIKNSITENVEYLSVNPVEDTEQKILDFILNKKYDSVAYMAHAQQPNKHIIVKDAIYNLTLEADKKKLSDFWNKFDTPVIDYLGVGRS